MPDLSVVIPSSGHLDLLESVLSSLREIPNGHQICVGMDPERPFPPQRFTDRWRGVKWEPAHAPGMHQAIRAAVEVADNDWIAMAHDDMVFLPGWDDFDLPEDVVACFELLDPLGLTWPPAVEAGRFPAEFKRRLAEDVTLGRFRSMAGAVMGGPHTGTFVLHRSNWMPWPEWSGTAFRTHDVAWMWETFQATGARFGWLPGRCLYHFVHGSLSRRESVEPDDPEEFVRRYGMTAQEAEARIYTHSIGA